MMSNAVIAWVLAGGRVGVASAFLLTLGGCIGMHQPTGLGVKWLPTCASIPADGLDPEVFARTQCGIATVPMDHLNPMAGTLALDITRVRARQPEKREGAVFTNPGGPGAIGGDTFTVALASIWKGFGEVPGGESFRDLVDAYDVIGISPRGLGSREDSQLVCESDEVIVAQNDISEDQSPANFAALQHNAGVLARGCASQRLAPYINTDQTARDMEFVRVQLKEDKLNYFGNSYGTWLGAWYGGLFPERVGRMVLDSNVEWTSTFQAASLSIAPEKERVFERFVAARAAADPSVYRMGDDPWAIREIFLELLPEVRIALRSDNDFYSSPDYLLAARTLSEWLLVWPGIDDAKLMAMASTFRFSPDAGVAQAARQAFASLLGARRRPALWNGIPPGPLRLTPEVSVRSTVLCNDTASSDGAFWTGKETLYASRYPVGGSYFYARHCSAWAGTQPSGIALRHLRRVDSIVMVQAEYDDHTPKAGALRAFESVPNAHLIVLEGAYQHGASFSGYDACVTPKVGEYLAYGRKPERLTVCPAAN
ncbi:alpha/beta fold hydrolase [Pseudomonas sp. 18175]|uniref:alpha/beta fold hydrolase n=1 Tax=Pseudomonas sp. 18175 TaxID=3390056 RepID=UPI003D2432BD